MPEIFDFTLRATAASGAYADRAFSITVRNTQIHRLLAVGPSGAARALNAASPWVAIPGVQGDSAAYGDRWLVWDQSAGVLWRSGDAIDWAAVAPVLPDGYSRLGFLRWRDEAWWAVALADRASHWEMGLATSGDGGGTWVLAGDTITASSLAMSFERSEAGASILVVGGNWHFRPDDASPWVAVRTGVPASGYRFQIAHLNGRWFAPNGITYNGLLAHAVDGSIWSTQTNPSPLIGNGYLCGMAWGNGYLVATAYPEGTTAFSTDAGLTVQAGSALPAAYGSYDSECPIVCQQGTFVMLGDTGRIFHAADPAGTWTAADLPGGFIAATLAVRN